MSYSNEAKVRLLGVPADLIEAHGAVSPEVARAMADGARAALEADVGSGSPASRESDGGTPAKPVGFVCLCVTTSSGIVLARDLRLPGNRADVRDNPSTAGTHLLLRAACPCSRRRPRRPRRPLRPDRGSRGRVAGISPRAPYGSPGGRARCEGGAGVSAEAHGGACPSMPPVVAARPACRFGDGLAIGPDLEGAGRSRWRRRSILWAAWPRPPRCSWPQASPLDPVPSRRPGGA